MHLLVVLGILGTALYALHWFAKSDLRKYGSAALSTLEEEVRPHAAEHRYIEEHVRGEEDDNDAGGDDDKPRAI